MALEHFVQYVSSWPFHLFPVQSLTTASTVPVPVALNSLQATTQQVLDDFVSAVEKIPCVEQIRASTAGSYMHVVVYVNGSARDQRFQIYDIEREFHQKHPYLNLEFDVVDRRGHPLEQGRTDEKHTKTIRIRDVNVSVS